MDTRHLGTVPGSRELLRARDVVSWVKLVLVLVPLSLLACDPEPPAATRDDPGAAAVPTVALFALDGYCAAMCKRTTTCGLQAAEAPASRGGDGALEALKAAKAGADELEKSCLAGCTARPVDDANRSAALRAERCLDEKDCAGLEKCLGEI